MQQAVVAVWWPQLELLFYQECGLDTAAAERLAPGARRYPALEVRVERYSGGALDVEVLYAPEQASPAYPPGATHQVRESYQITGDCLVLTHAKMELAR